MSEHGPANPVNPEPASPPAGQAMGRRDREGPALPASGQAMGRRDREGPAQAMEDERDLTAAFIAEGRPPTGQAAVRKQYAVTDAWAQAIRAQARGVGGAFPAQTRTDAAAVMTRITDLPDLRGYAIGSDAPALAVV